MAAAVQRIQEAAGLARSLWLELEQGTKTHEQVLEEARSLYKELLPLKKYTKRFDTFKDQVGVVSELCSATVAACIFAYLGGTHSFTALSRCCCCCCADTPAGQAT